MLKLSRYCPEKLYRATFICHYGLCCGIVWSSFLFDCCVKIWATCKNFWANGLPPPWRKIVRTPGMYNLSYSDPGGVLFIRNKEHYVSKEMLLHQRANTADKKQKPQKAGVAMGSWENQYVSWALRKKQAAKNTFVHSKLRTLQSIIFQPEI